MATAAYLFDVQAYARPSHDRPPRRRPFSPPVWQALQSLKRTLDELPEQELARRREAYEALTRSCRPPQVDYCGAPSAQPKLARC